MLERSFIHVSGVNSATERLLWSQGCATWAHFLESPHDFDCGSADRKLIVETLKESTDSLARFDASYFMQRLGIAESWRAYPSFRHTCVYLDIETDGGRLGNSVTVVGLYDGAEFRCLVKGKDLIDLPDIVAQYGMIVTFFGSGFDLPMLQKRFRGLQFRQLHLDLCPTFRKIGVRGGLKKIEKQFGLSRGEDTDGLGGVDAIRLWNRYQTLRDERSLETLISYNREDVVNLEALAEIAYTRLVHATTTP